jgi:hypothetical protein
MLRTTFTKTAALRPLRATFVTSARAMAAGDTGAPPKAGGQGYVNINLSSTTLIVTNYWSHLSQ